MSNLNRRHFFSFRDSSITTYDFLSTLKNDIQVEQRRQEDRLNKAQGEQEARLVKVQGEIDARLVKAQGEIDARLVKAQGEQEARLIKAQGDHEARLILKLIAALVSAGAFFGTFLNWLGYKMSLEFKGNAATTNIELK